MKHNFLFLSLTIFALAATAQNGYWQQHVNYTIEVELNPTNHQYTGILALAYSNNSPDTLKQVFFHLYPNAFQPESMMDVRSRNIADPDRRVGSRIVNLKEDEIGFLRVPQLAHRGEAIAFSVQGTVLQAMLTKPILPGETTTFNLSFVGQVPVQIRRSGRNNKEGIDYTMTQWYPKLAAYDRNGWHPDQYVGREFYGDFGMFDVKITMPANYVLGGTGVLQNPDEVGHGYSTKQAAKKEKLTWHFVAEQVHDFAWAADPAFAHEQFTLSTGTQIHLLYNPETAHVPNWKRCKPDVERFFTYMNTTFGPYAYPQFSIIQGGDGGMEYPMCTMMLGGGKDYKGFFGLFVHEATHNWFYGMLGTNEQRNAWMDEGFTSFAEEEAMNHLFNEGRANPHLGALGTYILADSLGILEPMGTPSDYYYTNRAYAIGSYVMGELFLMQLQYIVGDDAFWRGMRKYHRQWKFRHPYPEDFINIMEDESGLQLDWFLTFFTQTTRSVNYAIEKVEAAGKAGTRVTLRNFGARPMPVDVLVTTKNGTQYLHTIPLVEMYGYKNQEGIINQAPWPWTNPTYELYLSMPFEGIDNILLDPYNRSCDVKTRNNHWVNTR